MSENWQDKFVQDFLTGSLKSFSETQDKLIERLEQLESKIAGNPATPPTTPEPTNPAPATPPTNPQENNFEFVFRRSGRGMKFVEKREKKQSESNGQEQNKNNQGQKTA